MHPSLRVVSTPVTLAHWGQHSEGGHYESGLHASQFSRSDRGGVRALLLGLSHSVRHATPLLRFEDVPGRAPLSDEEARGALHGSLPILNGHIIMGTDFVASAGQQIRVGNNTAIVLDTDSREQADEFFTALSEAGSPTQKQEMAEMFWGACWGVCRDRFEVR